MKRFYTLLISLLVIKQVSAQGYQVTLNTPSYKAGLAYFTYHMGKNQNIVDSAIIMPNGTAVFKGKNKLPGGIYAIVFPGKSLSTDFFIDKDQVITVKADSADLSNTTVIGSKENQLFQDYQKYIAVKGKQLQAERTAYMQSKTKEDSALHEANYARYNKELGDYRENVIKTYPGSMMAALFNAMKEPTVPNKKPVTHQDSVNNYNYYKAHYWDGITFMDERVIRTPFFLPKLERYYREVMPQAPDSLIKDIDYRLLYARNSPEMYKFLLNWFTDEYINPKYMGQDAVFVHLFEKYHSKGVTSWLNEKQMDIITKRAYMLMANQLGEQAANLEMIDSTGKPTALYDVKSPYTIVVFWDPTCGHCKEEIPKLDSMYRASWKAKKVAIYAVLSENQKTEWVKYIKEHGIGDWVNVYQTKEMEDAIVAAQKPGFRQLYDVTSTPTLYLLDKDKRIIGKKLTWKQLDELLQVKMNSESTK
ncbi:MAG: thioredoxin-like domain-containing protein [Ferruginibacter sp.]